MACCSCGKALAVSVILALASSAGVHRDFDGSFTIVNQASGRRMSMTVRGFSATKQWPILEEQKWTLAPQGNFTYTIVNEKNKMRVLAQSGMDGDRGFFAIDNGPIYEDQKWRLDLQEDGSYTIINSRSGRRILARIGGDGGTGFAAIASNGPIRADERWWLINQEKDEGGKWFLQLEATKTKNLRLGQEFKAKVGETFALSSELKSIRLRFDQDLAGSQREVSQLMQILQLEKEVTRKLSSQLVHKQNQTSVLEAVLQAERNDKDKLIAEKDSALRELESMSLHMQAEKSVIEMLMGEVESKKGLLGCLWFAPVDEHMFHTLKVALLSVVVLVTSIFLPYLGHRLHTAHSKTAMLANELATTRTWQGQLSEEIKRKQARIDELENCLDCSEAPSEIDGELGFDFACQIFNVDLEQSTSRLIKIQCPGVAHEDVKVQLIFNGCEVTISRRASPGVEAMIWKRQFYWKPSEGLFEFKEDQMQLERGFLHLVFKAYVFQSRVIRFPMHFNLDADDNDGCWDFEADDSFVCEDDNPIDMTLMKPGSYIDTESTASTPRRPCTETL